MAPKRQSTGTKQAPARPNTFKPGDELVFEDEEGISPKTHSEQVRLEVRSDRGRKLTGSQTASPAKLKSVQAPSSVTNSSIPKSSSDKKKKKRSGSWLTTALLVYFIYANLFLCSDPSYATASNVCNGISFIDRTREAVIHRIDDLAQPYLEQAQTYAQPYLEPVQPYYDTLREHTDPLIAQGQQVYATHVQPRAMVYYQQARAQAGPLKLRLFMHYDTHAKPIVQRYAKFYGSLWRLNVAPALDRWTVEAHIKAKEGLVYLQHHVDAFQAEHFPVLHAWTTHTLWPFLKARAVTARYIVLHYIVPATKRTYAFTYDTVNGNIVPHLNRWYSLYATPQIARVKQKIWEHRTEQLAHAVVASELERQESVDHALHVLDNEPEQLTGE